MDFSQELKDTLNGLTYASVWVNSNGDHSFTSKEGWNEISRKEILSETAIEEVDTTNETVVKKKKK
jgi:hypothetical protein